MLGLGVFLRFGVFAGCGGILELGLLSGSFFYTPSPPKEKRKGKRDKQRMRAGGLEALVEGGLGLGFRVWFAEI